MNIKVGDYIKTIYGINRIKRIITDESLDKDIDYIFVTESAIRPIGELAFDKNKFKDILIKNNKDLIKILDTGDTVNDKKIQKIKISKDKWEIMFTDSTILTGIVGDYSNIKFVSSCITAPYYYDYKVNK